MKEVPGSPGKSKKEGKEDQQAPKQRVPLALLSLLVLVAFCLAFLLAGTPEALRAPEGPLGAPVSP